jgi:hypothetical protein
MLAGSSFGLARTFLCVGLVAALIASTACSSTEVMPTCDDAKCAPGNQCLALDGEVKCRKVCSSNTDPATSCPYGYACVDTLTGAPPFCVEVQAKNPDGTKLEQRSGQWGQQCQPNLGLENPACDTDQGFYCYAQSPTDANAYCTRWDCTSDAECGPGFWCGTVNVTPNVATAKRSTIGEVQHVCLKRGYCSTCTSDLDCLPVDNRPQHCIQDANGASFCTPECEANANCPNEARCADAGVVDEEGNPKKVCYPRATVCVGDGSLCSPCRADSDCGEDGICIKGEYTTERACAKKAPSGACDSCPRTIDNPQRQIGCAKTSSDLLPAGYCVGLYKIGAQPSDIGCWTPDRR